MIALIWMRQWFPCLKLIRFALRSLVLLWLAACFPPLVIKFEFGDLLFQLEVTIFERTGQSRRVAQIRHLASLLAVGFILEMNLLPRPLTGLVVRKNGLVREHVRDQRVVSLVLVAALVVSEHRGRRLLQPGDNPS